MWSCPVLLTTVKDAPRDVALGFEAGANDYVTKPFEATTLLARIQTLISVKSSLEEALQNEYAFYQAQIKPHFLYNALSSVISFCYFDGEKAAHLLTMLSEYLQYKLEIDRSVQYVSLHRELALIEAYVEIEKVRFQDRFVFQSQVQDHLKYVQVPSLCIQPFVENAIRHGLFPKKEQGHVSLTIRKVDEGIEVVIEDDGVGIEAQKLDSLLQSETSGQSIGIMNIRKRLQSISRAKLEIESSPGIGTAVTVYLPG